MKIEIKHINGGVLYTAEIADDCPEWRRLRDAAETAVRAGAYLGGAYLDGANLHGAYLDGANLHGAYLGGAYLHGAYLGGANLDGANLGDANLDGAYLGGANLDGAYLGGANLRGANLRSANLDGAYLGGANLDGAYLGGANLRGANLRSANLRGAYLGGNAKLNGARPIVMMGPIGSRNDTLTVFRTDAGLRVQTGCFFGTDAEFLARVAETHGDTRHGSDYRAALALAVQMLAEAK